MLQNVNEKRTSINFNGSTVPVIPAETKLNTKVSDSLAGDVATYNTDEYNTTVITEDKSLENNFLSLKEISNTLNSHLNKYGFSIKEENVESVLIEVFGYSTLDIKTINSEKLNNDVNSYILPALKKNKNNTKGSLEDVLQQAKDWHIAIEQGKWSSIEAYEQAQQSAINTYGKAEGIVERMKRVGPCKDITTLSSPEEQKAAINDYVKWLLDDAEKHGGSDPANYVSRDLTRLIINTKDDKIRGFFFEVIEEMAKSESYKDIIKDENDEIAMRAIVATVRSYKDQDQCSEDIVKFNVVTTVASLNLGQEETAATAAYVAEHITSETDARVFNKQIDEKIIPFWNEHKDTLNSISQKLEAGKNGKEIKLSAEEEEVYNEFQNICIPLRAGQNIGFANNENLPSEIKTLLFNEIQEADKDKELLQRESLAYTQHLIQENPDIINMSTEDFEKFMDEVTNGNYSIVKNDIANGTYTELNPPKAETEASGTSSIEETSETQAEEVENSYENTPVGGIGYNNTPEPPSANPTEKLETILEEKQDKAVTNPQQSQTPVTKAPTTIEDAVKSGSLAKFKNETGKTEFGIIIELLNSKLTEAISLGIERFTKLNKKEQKTAFESSYNNKICEKLLKYMSLERLKELDGKNHYIELIRKERIKAEEKNKTGFEANV